MNADIINTLIRERRSVFPQDYTGERVDDAIVKQILQNAFWAPTHKLTQPWRFVVFTGKGLESLAKAQAEVYKKVTQADGSFKEERYHNLLKKPMQSSHIIAVLMVRDEKKSIREVEEIGAVFCALQNMHLTASAYGVGAYLSTGGVTYFEEAKEIFGLEEDDRILGFFHLGIPKKIPSPIKRKPFDEVVDWVDQ